MFILEFLGDFGVVWVDFESVSGRRLGFAILVF